MADHDRLRVEAPDHVGVLRYDIVDAVTGHVLWVFPRLRDRGRVTGPAGRHGHVAFCGETVDPRSPRVGVEPQTVDEDDRRAYSRHHPILANAPCARKLRRSATAVKRS